MPSTTLLSFENDVFAAFAWYGILSVVKMMFMSIYIATYRTFTKTFMNEEDVASLGSRYMIKDKPSVGAHPAIERARRVHQNDLENVIPFFLVGLIFVLSNPDLELALLHFRIFFGVRVAHSVCYLFKVPQPSRFVFFFAGYVATLSMAGRVLVKLYT